MNPTDTNILACHQHAIEAKKKKLIQDIWKTVLLMLKLGMEPTCPTYNENIGHRAHRLFPFLECKCGAHFILMFTADKWIKMKTVPLYRKMHPISNECKRKNHVQVLGSHNKGSVKGVTCK